MSKLSHYDYAGRAHMVDVSAKAATRREAVARRMVELSDAVLAALPENPKGNPLEVARFAGIQAAKQTAELIPMCHPLPLSFVDVEAQKFDPAAFLFAPRPRPRDQRRRDGGDGGGLSRRFDGL